MISPPVRTASSAPSRSHGQTGAAGVPVVGMPGGGAAVGWATGGGGATVGWATGGGGATVGCATGGATVGGSAVGAPPGAGTVGSMAGGVGNAGVAAVGGVGAG